MPDRIVRAGILTSDPVNELSWGAEVFYRRMLSVVDDYGRYDGRAPLLRAHLYPLKIDKVSEADVGKWLTECVTAGLVSLYRVALRPYVEVVKFGQRVRADKSKWPAPSDSDPPSSADICQQAHADAAVFDGVVVDAGGDDKARKRAPRFNAAAIELPEWLELRTWERWVKDRTDRRKSITEEGAKSQLSKLASYREAGHTPESVIEHSIAGGYAGLFPPSEVRGQMPAAASSRAQTDAEARRRLGFKDRTEEPFDA